MASRREFIKTGGLATLVGLTIGYVGNKSVFGFEGFYKIPMESKLNSIANFTYDKFTPLVNSDFSIWQKGIGKIGSIRLVEVKKIFFEADRIRGLNTNTISLLFKANKNVNFEEGNYEFIHPKLSRVKLFVVPVTSDKSYYEVTVNNHAT